jgi:putative transposase
MGSTLPAYPNHVWGIDITYLRLRQGWFYLVAIIDWYLWKASNYGKSI